MDYLEVTIQTASAGIELVANALTAGGFDSLVVEDQAEYETFLEDNRAYWDYIDEEFQAELQGLSRIKLYLEVDGTENRQLQKLEKLLAALGLFMSLLMILFAVPTLKLVLPADSAGGMAHAVGYLRLVACFYLFNFLGSGLSGYFHGRGRVNLPVMGTTLHISMRVILSFFLAPKMGLEAVALATGIGWVCVVSFWTMFRKGDFRRLDA